MGCSWLLCFTWIAVLSGLGIVIPANNLAAGAPICHGNAAANEAFKSSGNLAVESIPGVGYGFYVPNPSLQPLLGGPNVTRGMIIIPADGVSPISYAPYARHVAEEGYYAAVVLKAAPGIVLEVMMQHSELEYWAIAGHGTAGKLAAKIAVTLQPRIRSLILIATPLPPKLDLRSTNLYVVVVYGADDTINSPFDIEQSFSRLPGDAFLKKFSGLGYYDFAYSICIGNIPSPVDGNSSNLTPDISSSLHSVFLNDIQSLQWYTATPRGLSFGDKHFLTPGFNDSKPYPGDIMVHFEQIDVPGTSPQRHWWVFTPTEIRAGLVYFSGMTVDGRAYFPLAFAIAARGHLVVIPEAISRNPLLMTADATSIIDSKLPIFSGVPKGSWAVGGHSAGGVAASIYSGCNGNKIYGAAMHSGGWFYNASTSEVPILQIYGSVDNVAGGADNYIARYLGNFNPSKTTFLKVDGANHYQVGDYGYQSPDQIATMGLDTQQELYAEITVDYLDSLEKKTYSSFLSGQTCTAMQYQFTQHTHLFTRTF